MSGEKDVTFKVERALHYPIVVVMLAVVVFGSYVAYQHIAQTAVMVEDQEVADGNPEAGSKKKPLPAFMLKTVKPDELEYLKQ